MEAVGVREAVEALIGVDLSVADHAEIAAASRSVARLQAFVRIDNALDRFHIGSVIVNEGNGRFYEPGAGRTFTIGARWHWTAR